MFFAQGKRQAHPGDIHHVIKLMEQRYSEEKFELNQFNYLLLFQRCSPSTLGRIWQKKHQGSVVDLQAVLKWSLRTFCSKPIWNWAASIGHWSLRLDSNKEIKPKRMLCELREGGYFIHFTQINSNSRADVWFGQKRMFFGLDYSHAPPQTLFERQRGKVPANPTVVGVGKWQNYYLIK